MNKKIKSLSLFLAVFLIFSLCGTTLFASKSKVINIFQYPSKSGDKEIKTSISTIYDTNDISEDEIRNVTSAVYDKTGNKYSDSASTVIEWTYGSTSHNNEIVLPVGDGYSYETSIDSKIPSEPGSTVFDVKILPEMSISKAPYIENGNYYFSWKPVEGASKYLVLLSKDQEFDKYDYSYGTSANSMSIGMNFFKGCDTWYVYITACNDYRNIAYSPEITLNIPSDFTLDFSDKNFERVIRKEIGKPSGQIMKSDVDKITVLNGENQGIASLDGIQFFENLEELYMQDNRIYYMPYLNYIKKLIKIDLSYNRLSAISFLIDNPSLKEANFSNNDITSLGYLSTTNLEYLDLRSNLIKEPRALMYLKSLKSLYLNGNLIKDYSNLESVFNVLINKDFDLESTSPEATPVNTPSPTQTPQGKLLFYDKNLENGVRDAINKPTGELTKEDLEYVTYINLSRKSIENLSGIENLPNLRVLDLSYNNIYNIGPIGNLTKLKDISLTGNSVSDISCLGAVSHLNELYLSFNKIKDISTLSKQTKLNTLYCAENDIDTIQSLKDIPNIFKLVVFSNKLDSLEPLKVHTEMTLLSFGDNNINDISVINNMPELTELYMGDNPIISVESLKSLNKLKILDLSRISARDFKYLSNLSELQNLSIAGNEINNIDFIINMKKLEVLNIFQNSIVDISPIASLKELNVLSIWNNNISDISALGNLKKLSILYLEYNPIKSIDVIKGLEDLERLALGFADVTDLSCLSDLTKIKYFKAEGVIIDNIDFVSKMINIEELYIYNNKKITNIEPLKNLKNLKILYIWGNKISDISIISGLTNLQDLAIGSNQITDISPLRSLTNIQSLYIDNNRISDISPLKNLTNLKTLQLSGNYILDFRPVSGLYSKLIESDFLLNTYEPATEIKLNRTTLNINKNFDSKSMTRSEFATYMVNTFNLTENPGSISQAYNSIKDKLDPNMKNYNDILIALKADIFNQNSFPEGKFDEQKLITRAEYAYAIFRALNYQISNGTYISDIDNHWAEYYIRSAVSASLISVDESYRFNPDDVMKFCAGSQLIPIIYPNIATDKKVTWKSSNDKVATVDKSGKITGVSNGKAIIYVTAENGKISASCEVIVSGMALPVSSPQNPGQVVNPIGVSNPSTTNTTPTPSTTVEASTTPTVTPTPAKENTNTPTAEPATAEPDNKKPGSTEYKDIEKHWAKEYILKLIEKAVISGFPDNTIKPDQQITRAEAAVIIAKAVGLKPKDSKKVKFTDAGKIPDWALGYVQAAFDTGIIKGYADGSFKPMDKLSRKEIAVMIVRAFNLGESTDKLTFGDSKIIPEWATGSISKAVSMNIIKGYEDNTFRPDKDVSRAEVFTMIAKCL